MRTRKEIEEHQENVRSGLDAGAMGAPFVAAGNEMLKLEVLLDIRDLLAAQKETNHQ